jgi:iron complex outermembrane receptor protein
MYSRTRRACRRHARTTSTRCPPADGSIGRPLPESETTKAYDIGWRVNPARTIASVALYRIDYTNRIVQSFDPDLGFSVDRNVGDVKIQGSMRSSASALATGRSHHAQRVVQRQRIAGRPADRPDDSAAPKGKSWSRRRSGPSRRADIDITDSLHAGLQAKKVDKRFTSDVND